MRSVTAFLVSVVPAATSAKTRAQWRVQSACILTYARRILTHDVANNLRRTGDIEKLIVAKELGDRRVDAEQLDETWMLGSRQLCQHSRQRDRHSLATKHDVEHAIVGEQRSRRSRRSSTTTTGSIARNTGRCFLIDI
jgi:hypothetical protein